jgi:hypothetical protein
MPVLPMVTVSAAVNLCDSAGNASIRCAKAREPRKAAPAPYAAWWMNCLRRISPSSMNVSGRTLPVLDVLLRVWVMDFFAPDNLTPGEFGQSLSVAKED